MKFFNRSKVTDYFLIIKTFSALRKFCLVIFAALRKIRLVVFASFRKIYAEKFSILMVRKLIIK